MLGTFSPQPEAYKYETPEETTPSGLFARGTYAARTKVLISPYTCMYQRCYSTAILLSRVSQDLMVLEPEIFGQIPC